MTEKKELIQQLKETDPDTYKKYRLEYMKSLFDLKKFQFLFLKNNQSRTWTENYMKKLLSKRRYLAAIMLPSFCLYGLCAQRLEDRAVL
ncbi:hypothetical protein [Dorea longicatena]|uniref:hypothetical protein n=1 Tax=Dorea longicatena TaxID=88431 RepID=UPI0015700900|nr:hypothetical protein [Dorea longicatena]NSE40164.1 hypothetical protein [Dorea longicatena]